MNVRIDIQVGNIIAVQREHWPWQVPCVWALPHSLPFIADNGAGALHRQKADMPFLLVLHYHDHHHDTLILIVTTFYAWQSGKRPLSQTRSSFYACVHVCICVVVHAII
jgi:hypothetical protein